MRKRTGNKNYYRAKRIIDKLVVGRYNLPAEMKFLKRLFEIYPSWDFWESFTTKKTTNSLKWFLSKWGRPELDRAWRVFQSEYARTKGLNPFLEEPEPIETKKTLVVQRKTIIDEL